MTGSTVRSCGPRDAGRTAQSSPMPKGARGEAEPSHRRTSAINFSSPRAATESANRLVKGFTGRACELSEIDLGEDQDERVQIEESVCHDGRADATRAFIREREQNSECD